MSSDMNQVDLGKATPSARRRFGLQPRLTLQTTLIIPYVILTLALATVGAYVVTQLVASSLTERFANQITEASRVAADGIVRRERSHLEDLRLMANTEGVPQAMIKQDVKQLLLLISPVAQNNQVEVVMAANRAGREIFTLTRNPDGNYGSDSQGADFSKLAFVGNVLHGPADDVGDKFVELLQAANGSYYLFTSGPVHDAGNNVVGVLIVGTRLENLLADLKREALVDVVVLDKGGKFIGATLPEPDQGFALLELNPADIPAAASSATRQMQLYGRVYEILYAPLIVRQQVVGVLGIVLPVNYIVSAAATSRNSISLIFAVGTGAVILLGYFLSRNIARPIQRLRVMSQAVAAGDLEQITGLKRSDEIGELASAFDVMTMKLRERTAEAARLYAETVQRNKELADINARLQTAQQQLVQSEKLAAIGQLTAGIVHDVKNPLAVIKGLAEVMLDDPDHDAEERSWLANIRDNAAKANQIVSDLLKFARQSNLERTQRDLRETVQASVRLTEYLARRARVKVVSDMPAQPVIMAYDAQQVEQVLINMIHNAIQAMPDGGALRLSLSQASEAAALAIQDTGKGIAPENLSRIFDPFFTTKPEGEGTGLGLSVSYGIISNHGGRIDVESQLGEGTTFIISLPKPRPEPEPAE